MGLPGILDSHERRDMCRLFSLHASKIQMDEQTGCWIWVGARQSNGYGRAWDGRKSQYAHRLMYELFNGGIPTGRDIDHLCRRRSCVNPMHLEAVSRSENLKRGLSGENIAEPLRQKTHCPRGHEYSGENLRVYRGRRHCKACASERYQEGKLKNGQ